MSKYNKAASKMPLNVTHDTADGVFYANKPGYMVLAFGREVDVIRRADWARWWADDQDALDKPWFVRGQWVTVTDVNADLLLCHDSSQNTHALSFMHIPYLVFPMNGA